MATDTISALGAGSGVDVKSLATNLVEAERAPRKAAIEKKIKASEGSVSGYAAIKYVLGDVQTAFSSLKNQSAFNVLATKNSQPNAFSVTTTATTATEPHTVEVKKLALPQRSFTTGFESGSVQLNSGAAFTLSLNVNQSTTAQSISIPANATTPQGIVDSVNAANKGVKAQLINTGDASNPIRILFTGESGATKSFELAGMPTGTTLSKLQSAQNAELVVDGVPIVSSTNNVQGAIANTTINLKSVTTEPASLDFERDTAPIKANLQALVKAYNDANSMLGVVSDPKSTVETYGATLVGNSLVGSVRAQMRSLITTSVNVVKVPAAQINLSASISLKGENGKLVTIAPPASNGKFTDLSAMIIAINAETSNTKIVASVNANGDLVLGNTPGSESNDITISGASNALNINAGTYGSKAGYGSDEFPGTYRTAPNALRDLGLSISAQGTLELNTTKLDAALAANFEGVVTLLTGNQENLSTYSQAPGGVANTSLKKLSTMLDINGPLTSQSNNLATKIAAYQRDLDKLETRMSTLLFRYNKQFAAMESMVGQTKSMKEGLTSTFEGMMASYTNK